MNHKDAEDLRKEWDLRPDTEDAERSFVTVRSPITLRFPLTVTLGIVTGPATIADMLAFTVRL